MNITKNRFNHLINVDIYLIFYSFCVSIIPGWLFYKWVNSVIRLPGKIVILILAFFFFFFLVSSFYLIFSNLKKRRSIIPGDNNYIHNLLNNIVFLFICILIIILVNTVFSKIDLETMKFDDKELIPSMFPIGIDYRHGIYAHALSLVNSDFKKLDPHNDYPPLQSILSLPSLLFSEENGYLIHTGISIFALLVSFVIIGTIYIRQIGIKILPSIENFRVYIKLIAVAFLLYSILSYPFLFSIERGQSDCIAFFFVVLGLFVLTKYPDKILIQVVLFSIAAHIKIYPSIFFVLLLIKHKKKVFISLLIVNIICLFCLGHRIAFSFINNLFFSGSAGIQNSNSWAGNHCLYSFISSFMFSSKTLSNLLLLLGSIFLCLSWTFVIYKIFRHGYNNINALRFFIVSTPIMLLLPTMSMDYRINILFPVLFIYFGLLIYERYCYPSIYTLIETIITLWIMLYLSRSYVLINYILTENSTFFFRNKFIWILLLYILMSLTMIRQVKLEQKKINFI